MDMKKTNIKLIKESKKKDMIPLICPACGCGIGMTAKGTVLNFFKCQECKAEWSRIDDPLKD